MAGKQDTYAVIGGEGFLGHAIVLALRERYRQCRILSLDVVQRHYPQKGEWEFKSCDLTDEASLSNALGQGISSVFHTASPHIGGTKELCEKVNVEGTRNIVDVCKKLGIKKLVYTSSAGIPFDCSDLINVDERCTPAPKPIDPYNDTKARAEAIVLEANDHNGLMTCAIRPSGIFGPGDRQNIPGFLKVYKTGKTKFTIGGGQNMFDWTYVGNVVYAHMLAIEKLGTSVSGLSFEDRLRPVKGSVPRRKIPTSVTAPSSDAKEAEAALTKNGEEIDPPLPAARNRFDQFFNYRAPASEDEPDNSTVTVAGQAFYITNGEPIPFWSWARALWYEYAGHDQKMINLPTEVGLIYARVLSAACWLAGKESSLPVASVYYSTARRYYNIEKARRVLGYEPQTSLVDGMKEAVAWYKANEAEIDAQQAAAQKVKA